MTDHTPVIEKAAERILDYQRFQRESKRQAQQRDPEEKHTGGVHKGYPGPSAADVLDDYTDDERLWCKLASEAHQLAKTIQEEGIHV